MCNLYIVVFGRLSSGPDFAVVLANNESEARDLAMEEVLKEWPSGDTYEILHIEEHTKLNYPNCIRIGKQCC